MAFFNVACMPVFLIPTGLSAPTSQDEESPISRSHIKIPDLVPPDEEFPTNAYAVQ